MGQKGSKTGSIFDPLFDPYLHRIRHVLTQNRSKSGSKRGQKVVQKPLKRVKNGHFWTIFGVIFDPLFGQKGGQSETPFWAMTWPRTGNFDLHFWPPFWAGPAQKGGQKWPKMSLHLGVRAPGVTHGFWCISAEKGVPDPLFDPFLGQKRGHFWPIFDPLFGPPFWRVWNG